MPDLPTIYGGTTYEEQKIEGTIGKTTNNTYMVIGANPNGNKITQGGYFNGLISCIRIYDRALTDEENAVNYLNDRDRYGV